MHAASFNYLLVYLISTFVKYHFLHVTFIRRGVEAQADGAVGTEAIAQVDGTEHAARTEIGRASCRERV